MTGIEQARQEIREADALIAELFQRRMKAVRDVAEYKKIKGLPVYDEEQEKRVLARNVTLISDESLRPYYLKFMQETMDISKEYQENLIAGKQAGCE